MASVACNSSLSVAAATVQCGAGKKRSSGGRKSVACPAFEGLSSRSLSLRITESVDLNSELESKRPESRSVTVCSLKDLRDRIATVKNTQKITDAMKLVAAAKVRRAQEAVVNGRPFSENLVKVLFNVNSQLQTEDIDIPLTQIRTVKKIALVVITGDRGLCGGFNNYVLKKAEERMRQLTKIGVDFTIVSIGKKGNGYFKRRPHIPVDRYLDSGTAPTTKEAQAIADELFSLFVSEDVDKVELLYTRFVSLIKSDPVIHTLLPLSPQGEVCDINGNCVDAADDEMFRLTTKEGKFSVERDIVRTETPEFTGVLTFEQEPVQILDALLPLYLNSQILRALQESIASELAARMNAMNNASDNARDLNKSLSISYNRQRQAKITGEILEIVAGSTVTI
jgi:F-type H+-transporting ATPase subunit gamma